MTTTASLVRAVAAAIALAAAPRALAAGKLVGDVQVSKRGEEATITVELTCPMRFASDARAEDRAVLEIRVKPLDACNEVDIGSISTEVYRPAGGKLALLAEIEYESLGLGENLLTFRFEKPVDYRVGQRGDLRTLQLIVRLPAAGGTESVPSTETQAAPGAPSAALAAASDQALSPSPPPSVTGSPAGASTAPRATASGRAPLMSRVRAPSATPDYILNLVSQREPVPADVMASLTVAPGRKPYVSEARVDGQTWYRLRIGFFGSEQEARVELEPLAQRFPKAWVGRAEPAEVELASSVAFGAGGLVPASAGQPHELDAVATAASAAAGATLTPEQLAELEQQGRDALVARDYATAIRVYTRLLQEPGEQRADAREYLGVARERGGQLAQAAAEYRAYLAEYPDGEGVRRVQQRLNGITLVPVPQQTLRKSVPDTQQAWSITSGISQYYRRDVYQLDDDQPQVVSLDALLTDVDVGVRHNGERVNVAGRLVVSNLYDLSGQQATSISLPNNPNRFSYAYVDVNQANGDWLLRAGRQTLHNWGILGRFDGLHFAYNWAPDRRVHFFSGYPVESTRYGLDTSREFYGIAVDFDRVTGSWGFSASLNQGTIEGINDRQSVGFEARYLDDQRSVTSMVDYDYGYGKLNSVLVLGTWRLDNRLTLTGLVDVRQSPVLTTRNALIGQPVTSISEMLVVWTEDEIRQIARDRTSDMKTVTLGVTKPLFERFQLSADVTATEIGASVESVSVPAMPSTGVQLYYSTSFVGSGLFGIGDVSVFNLRHGTAPDFTMSQVTWDARFPVGHRLRLNPRLRYGLWESPDGRRRETTSPSLRVLLSFRNHYHFEAEYGADDYLRTDPFTRENSTGNYINIGYRADF